VTAPDSQGQDRIDQTSAKMADAASQRTESRRSRL
jgi:hypothetical protein